nr:hypothetical protein [Amycolatopsis sp. CA-126428]
MSGYYATGDIRGALANTAEAEYSTLDDAEQAVAEQLFLRLIDLGEDTGAGSGATSSTATPASTPCLPGSRRPGSSPWTPPRSSSPTRP